MKNCFACTRRLSTAVLIILFLISMNRTNAAGKKYYQLTVYHYATAEQEQVLDTYLQQGLLPALHRMKIKSIGVWKAIANDTSVTKKMYVLVPYTSLNAVGEVAAKLSADKVYQSSGAAYLNAVYTSAPYTRMETILLESFPLAPSLELPNLKSAKAQRVYELRSYESATEQIFQNKVKMFNEGDEIGIFKKLNFNAIFYASVIAGNKMPNLMYMTSFESMDERNAHWKNFGSDPAWKQLSAKPEYKNNVSHIDIVFLRATEYSDY
jgi:hypothetical protein